MNKRDFEKFYQAHFDKVYRFVFFRTGHDRALAEDLVSEIFLKALEHFADFNPELSTSAWIMTIAKNHLKNHWRDSKPTDPLPESELGEDDGPGDSFWLKTGLREWQKATNRLAAAELLLRLDQGEREIVTFHYIFGYSYAEIGELKGMSEGAVKVAAHRAIKKSRPWL